MLALSLSLVAPLALGQLHADYVLSARAETRARPRFPGDRTEGPVAADAEITPGAALTLSRDDWRILAQYAPRLSLREPYAGGSASLLQSGSLAGEWRPNSLDRVVAIARTSYGLSDFLSPQAPETSGPQPPQPGTLAIEPVPSYLAVRSIDSGALLGAELVLTPRVRWAFSGGYGVSGALDAPAQAQLPLRQGPELRTRLAFEAGPVDTLSSELWATHSSFSNGSIASVVDLQEHWRRRLSERREAALALGAAGIRSKEAGQPTAMGAVPTGKATLTQRWPARERSLELVVSAGAVPFIDRFASSGYLRAEGSCGLTLVQNEQLRLGARGGAAYNLTGAAQQGDRAAVLDLTASYDLDRLPVSRWRVEGFLHGTWTQGRQDPGLGILQWGAGAAVTFRQHGFF